jgi:NAD(P)-dependent dehydrogenase (short-subunit alcohol dehydrogenase family)
MGALETKIAVVTGGASGIGRACAERFAAEGADVVVADLDEARGAETVAAIEGLGQRAIFVRTDTSTEVDNEALADAAIEEFGRIDVLLAAAGVSSGTYVSGEVQERAADPEANFIVNKPIEMWEKVLAVNLTGVMLTDRSIGKRMVAAGQGGAIVNIASAAAVVPLPGAADYCVSKAGVWMLTKALARELAGEKIRVNAIGPGFVETPMTQQIRDDEELVQGPLAMTPMGRFGEPPEIAATALYLASEESSFMTGQILYPGGGLFTG